MNKPYRQLILIPDEADWSPASTDWSECLREFGLLGNPVTTDAPNRFLIGKLFLQHVSFMGCSPAVEFEPDHNDETQWDSFTFVYVPESRAKPLWVADPQMARPACPHCQKRNADWVKPCRPDENMLGCVHCKQSAPLCNWKWFDGGGCARQFICIVNVFPREAIPSDHLLQQLANATGVGWHYFFLNAPLIEPEK